MMVVLMCAFFQLWRRFGYPAVSELGGVILVKYTGSSHLPVTQIEGPSPILLE